MKLLVTGLNYKTAPVEIRERVAFDGSKLEEGLKSICKLPEVKGAVILSTCNRVELYTHVNDIEKAQQSIRQFFSAFHSVDFSSLDSSLYFYTDSDAIRHIFRVASSLDSMIVGEPQILGQLKGAFEFSLSKKLTDVLLNKLLKKSISVAKRVRTETKIAENAVSISYAAVELARKIFNDLSKKSFMLLGAGDMAELAARHLINSGVSDVSVANRTYKRGIELAREFCGRAIKFEHFRDELGNTDIIICSTGAPAYMLFKSDMLKVMKKRKNRPVFIIDISVPRNIDPEVNDIDNVYLYNVDDLWGVVDTNVKERKREAEKAEEIVMEEVEKFSKWHKSLDSVLTIVALRNRADEIKRAELERLLNRLNGIDERQKEVIESALTAIVNKLIHPPTAALKEVIEDRDFFIATIKKLYGLEENND